MRGRSFLVLLSQKRAARKKTESVPQVCLQVCRPPFRCFFASTMIDNATIRTKSPCDWRRAILWQDDPASAQSRVDSIPHPFSLLASSLAKRPPSGIRRERQDRLFRLTGEAWSLFPVYARFSTPGIYHDRREMTSPAASSQQ